MGLRAAPSCSMHAGRLLLVMALVTFLATTATQGARPGPLAGPPGHGGARTTTTTTRRSVVDATTQRGPSCCTHDRNTGGTSCCPP
ncbi:hypothetical protein SORBI_3001G114300 [Sorghum bicolor]|nr:hypothetical protein SORBI_3001G114300 [Sorghum bicolor]